MSFIDSPFVPNGKIDRIPVPAGEENKFFSADEWNNHICQPLLDTRKHVLNGFIGIEERASAPSGLSDLSSTMLWGKTNGNLIFTRGVTDNIIAAGPVTTKGDLLAFNGTNFARFGIGTNGQTILADSSQASGLKWGSSATSTIYWTDTKTWTDVYAEVLAIGGLATVVIPQTAVREVTGVGPYDLSGVRFVSYGDRAILFFDVGTLIDGGASVVIDAENLLVEAQAPLMTPGSKVVVITLLRSIFSSTSTTGPAFTTSSNSCSINMAQSSIGIDDPAGNSIIHLSGAAARVVVAASGGGYSPQFAAFYTTGTQPLFTGVALSHFALEADALCRPGMTDLVTVPVIETLANQWGKLGLPLSTTVNLPAPTVNNKGQVAYDITAGTPKYSDGAAWQLFASGGGFSLPTTANQAAIGIGQPLGLALVNPTAAAAGAQQYSPLIEIVGQGWATGPVASQEVRWGIQARPVQDAANPSSDLVFWNSVNGSAYAELLAFTHVDAGADVLIIGASSYTKLGGYPGAGYTRLESASTQLRLRAAGTVFVETANLQTIDDATWDLGAAAARWKTVYAGQYDTKLGTQLTAAATITPVYGFHHITGGTTVTTIAATNMAGNAELTLIADGGTITLSTGGNIAAAVTIAQNKAQKFIYDLAGTTWYPIQ